MTHCRSCSRFPAAVSNTTKSPLQPCSAGHSLAMCYPSHPVPVGLLKPAIGNSQFEYGSGAPASFVLDRVLWVCLMEYG